MLAFFEELIEIFFPPSCLACGKVVRSRVFFCEQCDGELERLTAPFCSRCAEPGEFETRLCPRCALRVPPFTRAFAPFAHEGPIARAIHHFKYEDHPELAPALAGLLCDESPDFLAEAPRAVCAIPLHERRFRQRKYDQSQLLAGELARRTRGQLVDGLTRHRATNRQVGLSESAREHNVAGAFKASAVVRDQRILLIDDVFTTGSTARSAASTLLEAGANEVQVLTLARAVLIG